MREQLEKTHEEDWFPNLMWTYQQLLWSFPVCFLLCSFAETDTCNGYVLYFVYFSRYLVIFVSFLFTNPVEGHWVRKKTQKGSLHWKCETLASKFRWWPTESIQCRKELSTASVFVLVSSFDRFEMEPFWSTLSFNFLKLLLYWYFYCTNMPKLCNSRISGITPQKIHTNHIPK